MTESYRVVYDASVFGWRVIRPTGAMLRGFACREDADHELAMQRALARRDEFDAFTQDFFRKVA